MDMTLNDDQKALQDNVRRIGERVFAPFEGRWESEPKCVAEALNLLGQHRLLGLNLPEAYGGVGLGNVDAALCVEEMAKHSPDAGMFMAAASLGQAYYISAFGTEEQRRKFLPPICAGAFTTAIAITEPGAGTAATGMTTKAAISGDKIVINGRKHYVSNAGLAGVFIVYARLGTTRGAKGIGAILVERDAPGFKIERMSENMAGGFQADLVFDDCTVPATNLLMGEGAFGRLTDCYNLERCGGSAGMLGIATGAFDKALAYVQTREQFGKPLIEFQAVQLKLADMAMQLEAARLMLYQALTRSAEMFPRAIDASMVKVFTVEAAKFVTDTSLQLFGGAGYLKASGIERRYRFVRGFGIAGGPLDIHRTMIAGWLSGRRFSQWAKDAT